MLEAVDYNMEQIIPSNDTIQNNDSPTQAPPSTKTTPTTSTEAPPIPSNEAMSTLNPAPPTPLINKRNSKVC